MVHITRESRRRFLWSERRHENRILDHHTEYTAQAALKTRGVILYSVKREGRMSYTGINTDESRGFEVSDLLEVSATRLVTHKYDSNMTSKSYRKNEL